MNQTQQEAPKQARVQIYITFGIVFGSIAGLFAGIFWFEIGLSLLFGVSIGLILGIAVGSILLKRRATKWIQQLITECITTPSKIGRFAAWTRNQLLAFCGGVRLGVLGLLWPLKFQISNGLLNSHLSSLEVMKLKSTFNQALFSMLAIHFMSEHLPNKLDAWCSYEEQSLKNAIIEWCNEYSVKFSDGS